MHLYNFSLCVSFRVIDVTRSLIVVAKTGVKLQATVLPILIVFNVSILTLFFTAPRLNYTSLFTNLSRSLIREDYLREVIP